MQCPSSAAAVPAAGGLIVTSCPFSPIVTLLVLVLSSNTTTEAYPPLDANN